MPPQCHNYFQIPLHCEETYQDNFSIPGPKIFYHPSPIIHPTSYPLLYASKSSLPYQDITKFDACDALK